MIGERDPAHNKKVQQVGLTCQTWREFDDIASRVDAYNRSANGVYVILDYMETPPEEMNPSTGRFRLSFTFQSRRHQQKFWGLS